MFPVLVHELEQAKHFIFIEYFIINDGVMWQTILNILEKKAKEGVDVRLKMCIRDRDTGAAVSTVSKQGISAAIITATVIVTSTSCATSGITTTSAITSTIGSR